MSNYIVDSADLTSVANAIRTKGGTSASLAFPAGFVQAIGDIPSGGGSAAETGSFIASEPLDSVTIPVASQKSHVRFWIHGMKGNMDLSGTPFGTYHLVYFEAHEDLLVCAQGHVSYSGTAFTGGFAPMQTEGVGVANRVVFGANSIGIDTIRVGGVARKMVDGAIYDWEAW